MVRSARKVQRAALCEPLESRTLLSALAPSSDEVYFWELTNYARANPQVVAKADGLTISNTAVQPLAINYDLVDAAVGHSDWMQSTGTFSHGGPGSDTPESRMQAAGFPLTGHSYDVGENIAWDSDGSSSTSEVTYLFKILFQSTGHRENTLNGAFKFFGAGVEGGSRGTYVTEDFGTTSAYPDSYITGATFDDKGGSNMAYGYQPGDEVGDVKVTAVGGGHTYTVTTDSNGAYEIAVPNGTYKITFSNSSFGTYTTTVVVKGSNVLVNATTQEAKAEKAADEVAAAAQPTVDASDAGMQQIDSTNKLLD